MNAMTFPWRALCLLHVLPILIPLCTTATSWQERDLITTRLHESKSPKLRHWKKSHHHKRDAWTVDQAPPSPAPSPAPIPAPSPSAQGNETCTTEAGCIFNVMTFDAVGDGITDDTKVDTKISMYQCTLTAHVKLSIDSLVFCQKNLTDFDVAGIPGDVEGSMPFGIICDCGTCLLRFRCRPDHIQRTLQT